jgi:hypothetical protein
LGDDIVIKDDKVSKRYVSIMHRLGVKISPTKTHTSKEIYEFAKRWIRLEDDNRYVELSPIPVKGIHNNLESPSTVFMVLFDYFIIKGNLYMCKSSLTSLIINIYNRVRFLDKSGKQVLYSRPYLRNLISIINMSIRYSLDLN